MNKKLFPPLLVLSLATMGQGCKTDCEKMLDRTPYFVRHNINEPSDSLRFDMQILQDCGRLDSIDVRMLNGPMLGTLLVRAVSEHKAPSYRTVLESIDVFRKSPDYPKLRESLIAFKKLEHKTASLSTFDEDKKLLERAGIPEAEIAPFRMFLEAHAAETMTYREAYAAFSKNKPDTENLASSSKRVVFRDLVSLEQALKIGKEEHKRILVYFSAYASVNCRKMEARVFSDDEVNRFMPLKFASFSAYLDDNRPDEQFGTVGKRYIKLQSEKFGSSLQPYFYILDEKGNVVSELMYTSDPQQFLDFLRKGLK